MKAKKKAAVLAAALLATALVPATPAPASGPGDPGPAPQDLGLEALAVKGAALSDPRTGEVVVAGTVTCAGPLHVLLHSSVRQGAGRGPHVVEASGGSEVFCDGETPFALAVSPEHGRLKAGDAEVFAGDPSTGFDTAEVGPVRTALAPPR